MLSAPPRRRRISLLAPAVALLTGCAGLAHRPAPAPGSPADTLTLQARERTFDAVARKVEGTFWDLRLLDSLGWHARRERYRQRALATPAMPAFHALLDSMVRELRLSHFAVVEPAAVRERFERARRETGDVGITLRTLADVAVVTRVRDGSDAAAQGIRPGFVVDSVDGGRATPDALVGPRGTSATIRFRDAADAPHTATVARAPRIGTFHRLKLLHVPVPGLPSVYGEVESRWLPGRVGYIRLGTFLDALYPDVHRVLETMRDATGIVIDLRGNGGGQDHMGRRIAGRFVDRRLPFAVSVQRGRTDTLFVAPHGRPLTNALVVLVDRTSSSASEQFAAGLQALGRAVVVGERTAGRDLESRVTRLPSGGALQYAYGEIRTPRGLVIEGRGVTPDREVVTTRASLLAGTDAQLDAAAALARRSR